jgi:hypothetical protein
MTLNNELTYIRILYTGLYALDQVKYENPLANEIAQLQQIELLWLTQA